MFQKRLLTALFICLSLPFVSSALKDAKNSKVGTKQNPGKSCKDILARGQTLSKTYYIRLGGEVLHVYCDQTTAGGGWTLVLSYTFTDFKHFDDDTNAITPRPCNWPIGGEKCTSAKPPTSETDYTAMDFKLWKHLGGEFIIKSNVNNWFSCSEGTGSLVHWKKGSVNCKLLKNLTGKCSNVVPDSIRGSFYGTGGMTLYDSKVFGVMPSVVYYLKMSLEPGFPLHDPCGQYAHHPPIDNVANPHGNIYIR